MKPIVEMTLATQTKSKYQMLVRNDNFPYITHPKSVQHYSSTSSLLKSDVIFPRNCTNESEGNPLIFASLCHFDP